MNCEDAMNKIAETAQTAVSEQDDFTGDDGLLYCGKCKTAKQVRIPFGEFEGKIMYCTCKCKEEEYNRMMDSIKANEQQLEIRKNTSNAYFTDDDSAQKSEMLSWTFANSDNANPRLMQICRAYCERFSPDIKWLILYGGTGNGKSYAAGCIANELLSKGHTVKFFTMSQFERRLFDSNSKQDVYSEALQAELIVLDDLGMQRNSEYMNEILFNLVDARLKNGKPMVITTNLTIDDLLGAQSLAMQRIMSRLCEKSAVYHVHGDDRRVQKLKAESRGFLTDLLTTKGEEDESIKQKDTVAEAQG